MPQEIYWGQERVDEYQHGPSIARSPVPNRNTVPHGVRRECCKLAGDFERLREKPRLLFIAQDMRKKHQAGSAPR